MKYLPALICCVVVVASSPVVADTLIADGKSDYVIVLPQDASPSQQAAGRELQEFLRQVSGVQLPILSEQEVSDRTPQIVVGESRRAKELVPDDKVRVPGRDGICLRTVGRHLVLTGAPPRGALYAVNTFLEDVVGCRWWTSTEATIPQRATIELPQLQRSYAPQLISREAFYRDAYNSPFAVRLKLNGNFMNIPREFGGHLPIVGWCHTFFQFLPPAEYFAEHPEWYSEIDGKRSSDGTQLCLTNETMRQEFVRRVLEQLDAQEDPQIISVSQNDWGGRCQCRECMELEQREGSPAGVLLHFVNAVAEEVEKKYPDVLIETLAYQYTRSAPRHIKPRDNVLIRLCTIECSFCQPLATGPQNTSFRDDMQQWSAIAPKMYVWNYVTNFSNFLLPHPNMRPLADDIRFFVDHHTVGLFEQGDAYSTTGDFIRLRTWVLSHLMWDPSLDQQTLMDEFLQGYYGAAAPHLRRYLDLLEDAVMHSETRLGCFTPSTTSWLTIDTLNEATKIFREAEKAVAGDELLAQRVRRERLPVDLAWLANYYILQAQARKAGCEFLGPADPVTACRQWIEQNEQLGNRFYGEGRPFDEYAANLARQFRPAAPVPEFCRDLPRDTWLDIQDNHFALHNAGTWASWVEDPQASDGMAARMPASHTQWAVQYPLNDGLVEPGRWRCVALVRCQAKAEQGTAFHGGLYDASAGKAVTTVNVPIAQCAGEQYQLLDLGVHPLHNGMYFWFAPNNNPQEVAALFVDRIVLIKAP